jgi:hypothetical protein
MIPALINLIIWLLIVGILLALVYYVLDAIPIPQPFNRIIRVVLVVVAVLVVVLLLLQLIGGGGVQLPKLT